MCASVEYSDYGSDVRAMRVFVDGYIRQYIIFILYIIYYIGILYL